MPPFYSMHLSLTFPEAVLLPLSSSVWWEWGLPEPHTGSPRCHQRGPPDLQVCVQTWAALQEKEIHKEISVREREKMKAREKKRTTNLPNTTSSAGSLSFSPTILVPTHTYIPASLFRVLEIISFPPRICKEKNTKICQGYAFIKHLREKDTKN